MNSLPKTVTQQHRGCDLNPGPTAPESSTLTTQLPSQYALGCINHDSGALRFCSLVIVQKKIN